MKTKGTLVIAVCAIILAAGFTFGNNPASKITKYSQIELNLLEGIATGNEGVQIGSAYYLGEMKSSKAILPLLKMLHEGKTESARISAAVALIKIGDSRGVFAVKQSATFDESAKVRRMCKLFYNDYLRIQKG